MTVIPIAAKKPRPARPERSSRAFLTPEETLAVLRAARSRCNRDWAMILVAYRHGLRASEVCELRLADVDLKDLAVLETGAIPFYGKEAFAANTRYEYSVKFETPSS